MRAYVTQSLRVVLSRSAWQLIVFYLLGSWALLGHLDLLISRFGIPDWTFKFGLGVVVIGLIVVVVLSIQLNRPGVLTNALEGMGLWLLLFSVTGELQRLLNLFAPSNLLKASALGLAACSLPLILIAAVRSAGIFKRQKNWVRSVMIGLGLWAVTAHPILITSENYYSKSARSETYWFILGVGLLFAPVAILTGWRLNRARSELAGRVARPSAT